MATKPKQPKKPGRFRYFFLAVLVLLAVGTLWDGAPLPSLVLQRALAIKFSGVPVITPAELVAWTRDPNRPPPLLIDTRTSPEFGVSHLADAIRLDPVEPDLGPLANVRKEQPIVFYCANGFRSTAMAVAFQQQGYSQVYNLAGGIFRWANEGRPLVKEGGTATLVHPFSQWYGYLLKRRYRAALQ